jgi:hypothetical protein
MEKELSKLSKEELVSLIQSLIGERDLKFIPHNKISVCDVGVESNIEPLEKCKKIANDLIKTNDEFITLRKSKLFAERNWGYFG